MSGNTGEYRVSRNALIIVGAVMLALGIAWFATGFIQGVAVVIGVIGLVLLIVGLLRPRPA